jgi:glycopeptide antibiotics resistance protein
LGAILVVTLRPVDADNDLELLPLGDLLRGVVDSDAGRVREAVAGALANMLLFVPLGAVVAFRGWSLARVAAVAFFVSASVEVAQLFVPGRTTSLDDVVFNVSGSVLGYALVAARARETPTVPAAGGRERRASETPCTNPRR